ncbi:MAG: DUF5112 domain-containing protein [Bacteroidales bacterium]|nr:DUF5112 domain-containing protein [Bacteroidales bacterium]
MYLCIVKYLMTTLVLLAAMLFAGCQKQVPVDPLRRSVVDGLNKEAFVNRYRDPDSCIAVSERALRYIADSLPEYVDGELRARNNMAFAYYQMSDAAEASAMLDHVDKIVALRSPTMSNGDIEMVISQLIRARLLQRDCRIADSYRLLYHINHSGVLERSRGKLLYDYAQAEYYITMLVLNYHYRDGKDGDVRTLLSEIEEQRPRLKVDYAQDMALNYALAYGWQSAGESTKALDYCDDNFDILERPGAFCTYHYANTMQMMASALKGIPGPTSPDSVLDLYDAAREAFFEYGDPYQMLGGVTSTARYALLIGDTLKAHEVLSEWRSMRGTWKPFSAPKMEVGYFDVLIRSRLASKPDEVRTWYVHRAELQDYIARNEREDFALQQSLSTAQRRSRWMTYTAIGFGVLAVILLALTTLLWIAALRLRREKRQLEAAKRRDVERIANVETTLSVLRHDVSPFMGYLNSPDLTPELRDEVLQQLLRTFDNIKNWTSLSIPSGLAFNRGTFPLQEVFDEVQHQVLSPKAGVCLHFVSTPLQVTGDKLLLIILLRNLINNALQHTPSGSVTVAAQADGEMVDITVADTGSGMTAEQVEALFRADRTLPAGSEHGFGLILCRYIIKKHDDLTRRGCRIWAESEVGRGTTMHMRLSS